MKDISESTVLQAWSAIAILLLWMQCFGLLFSAAAHVVVSIWQGLPITLDSASEIMTSGMPLLTALNAVAIPKLVFYILLPGTIIGFVIDKARAKQRINEKGVQA